MRKLLIAMGLALPLLLGAVVGSGVLWSSTADAFAYEGDSGDIKPPEASPATGKLTTVDAKGEKTTCADIAESKGGVFLGAIVPCLAKTIELSTVRFTEAMVKWLEPVFYAFLTLVVALFGARLLQQEPNITKQGFLLLVKIAIVATILADLGNVRSISFKNGPGEIIPAVYSIMNESQQIITGAINSTSFSCDVDNYAGPNTPRVWAMMDCVMGKMFGFKKSETADENGVKAPGMLLAASMIGSLAGFLFGGTWSIVIFFGMLGVLVSIFMLVVRTAFAFINGYLIASLVIIISPLIIPLVFMNVTKTYFEGLFRNFMAAFLMPIMVCGYAMFALIIYDKMLFAPDSMVQKIFKYDEIKEAMQNPKKLCDKSVTGDPGSVRLNNPGDEKELSKILTDQKGFMSNNAMPGLVGANNLCALFPVPNFNIKDGKSADFKKGKATYDKLFYELLTLFILGFLLHEGLKSLNGLILNITGARSTNAGTGALPGEERFKKANDSARAEMMGAIRSMETKGSRGNEVSGAPLTTARAGVQGAFKGLKG